MNNPLGSCQESKPLGGTLTTCQAPLCIRGDRIECQEGHPQPGHPMQKQLDEARAKQAEARKNGPKEPSAAPYVPEPTWVAQARALTAQARRIDALEARLSVLESQLQAVQAPKRKPG